MMAEVVPLDWGKDHADRRVSYHQVLDQLLDSFEDAIPEAVVIWAGNMDNHPPSRTTWRFYGKAYSAASATLAKAIMVLQAEVFNS